MDAFIKSLESRVKMIEESITNAAAQVEQWTKNHVALTGMLQGVKESIAEAQKLCNVIAPDSEIAAVINEVEEVIADVNESRLISKDNKKR